MGWITNTAFMNLLLIVEWSFYMKSSKHLAWCDFCPIRLRNSSSSRFRLHVAPVIRCLKERTQFENPTTPTPLFQLHDSIVINETPTV